VIPEERSRKLRKEANEVLKMIKLKKHCAPIGKVVPTGSYYMDLMMYPDIDLYLPSTTIEKLFTLAAKFATIKCVKEVVFQKGSAWDKGDLAKGYYLKPIVEHGTWGRPWKVDIWSLPSSIIEKKNKHLRKLKERMTPQQRKLILEYKYSILTDQFRTPMFSGIYIYRAVIDLGMTDFRRITKYLKDNGIKMK
jgi:hypothetical protein